MYSWYITQPLLVATANLSQNLTQTITVDGDTINTTGSDQTYTLIRLGANIGFPLAIIFLWIWAFVSSQAEDWRGEQYG